MHKENNLEMFLKKRTRMKRNNPRAKGTNPRAKGTNPNAIKEKENVNVGSL